MWIKLIEDQFPSEISEDQFWKGLDVWIKRPHIINRKLLATEEIKTLTFSENLLNDMNFNKSLRHLTIDFRNECYQFINSKIKSIENNSQIQQMFQPGTFPLTIELRKLIPRDSNKFADVTELVILDRLEKTIVFWSNENDTYNSNITPMFPYAFTFINNGLSIKICHEKLTDTFTEEASKQWLCSVVFPKVFRWCFNSPAASVLPSLNLVCIKKYSENYKLLKAKYGKKYVENWTENTDPSKYVYEDISIAAYLMTLWENERAACNSTIQQSFVDLGCGNGLLVDILTSEGVDWQSCLLQPVKPLIYSNKIYSWQYLKYSGIGIDIRRRKIWDLYDSKKTQLIERVIEPSDYHIFPNYDWIIGNHSDELTPWIPVIAARSSYKMKVFLLPCCFYTFDGKYERLHSDKTQYQSYLSFIELLCESMGFNVKKDKLRIPSTKRICFVCSSRSYQEREEKNIELVRKEFIKRFARNKETSEIHFNEEMNQGTGAETQPNKNWILNFKPRENVVVVQNCSNLDRNFLDETVRCVASILLKTDNFISLQRGPERLLWNSGGCLKINNLIKLIEPEALKKMKKQCGGFQTFLRNHRNVFSIKDGIVQLTVPSKEFSVAKKLYGKRKHIQKKSYSFKEKPCYFFFHHPQGCPLDDSDCSFSHRTGNKVDL